jgi:hypothetical protein
MARNLGLLNFAGQMCVGDEIDRCVRWAHGAVLCVPIDALPPLDRIACVDAWQKAGHDEHVESASRHDNRAVICPTGKSAKPVQPRRKK